MAFRASSPGRIGSGLRLRLRHSRGGGFAARRGPRGRRRHRPAGRRGEPCQRGGERRRGPFFSDRHGAAPAAHYDVVVANILANPLVVLAPLLAARVRAGGRIVLSGILDAQADSVIAAYAGWFNIAVWKAGEDGWVALAGTRRAG
jgi:hypothetical protein